MRQITYSGLIAAIVAIAVCGQAVAADEATVIELTQTPCQFLESENGVESRLQVHLGRRLPGRQQAVGLGPAR